jgi:hypothetical protein
MKSVLLSRNVNSNLLDDRELTYVPSYGHLNYLYFSHNLYMLMILRINSAKLLTLTAFVMERNVSIGICNLYASNIFLVSFISHFYLLFGHDRRSLMALEVFVERDKYIHCIHVLLVKHTLCS